MLNSCSPYTTPVLKLMMTARSEIAIEINIFPRHSGFALCRAIVVDARRHSAHWQCGDARCCQKAVKIFL